MASVMMKKAARHTYPMIRIRQMFWRGGQRLMSNVRKEENGQLQGDKDLKAAAAAQPGKKETEAITDPSATTS